MSFEKEYAIDLDLLANHSCQEVIHGVAMTVKPVPAKVTQSALDKRVYDMKVQGQRFTPPANVTCETMAAGMRMMGPRTVYDLTDGNVASEKITITTRDGAISGTLLTPTGGRESKPALVFFHGGAYIAGFTEDVEAFCRVVAYKGDCIVVLPDYRLAPEHKYPASVNDCYDTVKWTYENAESLHINKKFIAVAGDSAGGTMAACACLLDKKAVAQGDYSKQLINLQILIYPSVLITTLDTEDFKWNIEDYNIDPNDTCALASTTMLDVLNKVLGEGYYGTPGLVTDPDAAPLLQKSLKNMPKTICAISEFDYLRLSEEAYVRKLTRDGVECKTIFYKGMDHGYIGRIDACPQAYDLALEAAKEFIF